MAKTCGDCEKCFYESGFENGRVFERYRCSLTGKIHDMDFPCDVPEKPRLCEVLGVEVGQRFRVSDDGSVLLEFYIDDEGYMRMARNGAKNVTAYWLINAINHPDRIECVPRLTPEEVQRCRDFGAKWVGRLTGSPPEDFWAMLFSERPRMGENGPVPEKETYIGAVRADLFPSVGIGDLIQVEDEPSEGAAGQ